MTKTDPIILYPNAVLSRPCNPVTEFDENLRELAEAMYRSMYAGDGIGLAANQIGVDAQVAVIDLQRKRGVSGPTKLVLVNPSIMRIGSRSVSQSEGCLSVPKIREHRSRALTIWVDYQSIDGKKKSLRATGLLARAIQHECDHLAGRLCLSDDALRKFAQSREKGAMHG
jgi:peptide deformylase